MQPRKLKIQNIIALGGRGEFGSDKDQAAILNRLTHHVFDLLNHTRDLHAALLQRTGEETADEIVTRLITNEFSLYTPGRPLFLEEYKTLINKIHEHIKNFSPNLHFVLGTLPVLWPDQEVHNAALHIQSPRKKERSPIIHHLDKRLPDGGDPTYSSDTGDAFQLYNQSFIEREDYYDLEMTEEKIYQLLKRSNL